MQAMFSTNSYRPTPHRPANASPPPSVTTALPIPTSSAVFRLSLPPCLLPAPIPSNVMEGAAITTERSQASAELAPRSPSRPPAASPPLSPLPPFSTASPQQSSGSDQRHVPPKAFPVGAQPAAARSQPPAPPDAETHDQHDRVCPTPKDIPIEHGHQLLQSTNKRPSAPTSQLPVNSALPASFHLSTTAPQLLPNEDHKQFASSSGASPLLLESSHGRSLDIQTHLALENLPSSSAVRQRPNVDRQKQEGQRTSPCSNAYEQALRGITPALEDCNASTKGHKGEQPYRLSFLDKVDRSPPISLGACKSEPYQIKTVDTHGSQVQYDNCNHSRGQEAVEERSLHESFALNPKSPKLFPQPPLPQPVSVYPSTDGHIGKFRALLSQPRQESEHDVNHVEIVHESNPGHVYKPAQGASQSSLSLSVLDQEGAVPELGTGTCKSAELEQDSLLPESVDQILPKSISRFLQGQSVIVESEKSRKNAAERAEWNQHYLASRVSVDEERSKKVGSAQRQYLTSQDCETDPPAQPERCVEIHRKTNQATKRPSSTKFSQRLDDIIEPLESQAPLAELSGFNSSQCKEIRDALGEQSCSSASSSSNNEYSIAIRREGVEDDSVLMPMAYANVTSNFCPESGAHSSSGSASERDEVQNDTSNDGIETRLESCLQTQTRIDVTSLPVMNNPLQKSGRHTVIRGRLPDHHPFVIAVSNLGITMLSEKYEGEEGENDEDSRRARFLADLKSFLEEITVKQFKIPVIGGGELDIYELMKEVMLLGGVRNVVRKRAFRIVAQQLGIPKTCTSAASVLKGAYEKLLFHYEQRLAFGIWPENPSKAVNMKEMVYEERERERLSRNPTGGEKRKEDRSSRCYISQKRKRPLEAKMEDLSTLSGEDDERAESAREVVNTAVNRVIEVPREEFELPQWARSTPNPESYLAIIEDTQNVEGRKGKFGTQARSATGNTFLD